MLRSPFAFACAVVLLLSSCQPEIGDECANSSDCSVQDQRTCDTTLPGGYCTLFGCGPGTCPSEAACIGFQSVVSVAPECASVQNSARLQRTVCMRSCDSNSDCRGGYACIDMAVANSWGAFVLDRGRGSRVCALPPPPAPEGDGAVCSALPVISEPLPPDAGDVDAASSDAGDGLPVDAGDVDAAALDATGGG